MSCNTRWGMPYEQDDAGEDDITIAASYELAPPQMVGRINIAQDDCAAVQGVRSRSRKKSIRMTQAGFRMSVDLTWTLC